MQFDSLLPRLYRIPLILYIYLHHKAMNGRKENQLFEYKRTQKRTSFHTNEQCMWHWPQCARLANGLAESLSAILFFSLSPTVLYIAVFPKLFRPWPKREIGLLPWTQTSENILKHLFSNLLSFFDFCFISSWNYWSKKKVCFFWPTWKQKCRKQNIRGPIQLTHKWVPTQCLGNSGI